MKYLNTNFGFEPEIINIDFDKPLRKALSSENLFKKSLLLLAVFFILQQLYTKMIIKKRLTKIIIEILRNIQLICSINPTLIKKFSEILKNNLNGDKECELYKYVYNQWIKKILKILIILKFY